MNYKILSNLNDYKYDILLIWPLVKKCNLQCSYCIANSKFVKDNKKIEKIDIKRLMNTLNNSNKTYRIELSGGEPLLVPNIIEACQEITKKHYITLISNFTLTGKIKQFSEKINPKRVLGLVASLHIKELEKRAIVETFISNFLLLKQKGFHIKPTMVAYTPIIPEIHDYLLYFEKRGIHINLDLYKGKWQNKEYPESYSQNESKSINIDFTKEELSRIKHRKGVLCNTGYNAYTVTPDGDIHSCYASNKKLGNIYTNIQLPQQLIRCSYEDCPCAIDIYQSTLIKKALIENHKYIDNYCLITNNIHSKQIKKILKNGYIKKIKHARNVLPYLKDGYYDVIYICIFEEDIELVSIVRKIIGTFSRTKIIGISGINQKDFLCI